MVGVAGAIRRVEEAYPQAVITAQSVMRPGDSGNSYYRQWPGLPERLREEGRRVVRAVFGRDSNAARRAFERFGLRSIVRATRMRVLFDPEYLSGRLGENLESDAASLGASPDLLDAIRRHGTACAAAQNQFQASPGFRQMGLGEQRAARVAFHIGLFPSLPVDGIPADLVEAINQELTAVRFHHSLALVEHAEFWSILREVGGYRNGATLAVDLVWSPANSL